MPKSDPPVYENPELRDAFDAQSRAFQKRFWDGQAENWQDHQNTSGLQPAHLDGLDHWFADPVLLIGAARGLILQALRASGRQVSGVDWSQAMVDAMQRDGISDVQKADATDLPFEDQHFGSVLIASGVVMPTHAQARVCTYLREAARVLQPGGALILTVCHKANDDDAKSVAEAVQLPIHTLHAQVFWDLAPLEAAACAAGLRVRDKVECPGAALLRLTV